MLLMVTPQVWCDGCSNGGVMCLIFQLLRLLSFRSLDLAQLRAHDDVHASCCRARLAHRLRAARLAAYLRARHWLLEVALDWGCPPSGDRSCRNARSSACCRRLGGRLRISTLADLVVQSRSRIATRPRAWRSAAGSSAGLPRRPAQGSNRPHRRVGRAAVDLIATQHDSVAPASSTISEPARVPRPRPLRCKKVRDALTEGVGLRRCRRLRVPARSARRRCGNQTYAGSAPLPATPLPPRLSSTALARSFRQNSSPVRLLQRRGGTRRGSSRRQPGGMADRRRRPGVCRPDRFLRPMILGARAPDVLEAVAQAAARGFSSHGTLSENEVARRGDRRPGRAGRGVLPRLVRRGRR